MTVPQVRELLERSHRLGADRRNTNWAGGNASVKGPADDPVTGRPVELLWVKGSGGDLGTLTEQGLSILRLDRLRSLVGVYPGADREDEMASAFDYCLHGRGGAAPSIDTAMHGLVTAAHVDHLHPESGIALATAADGEALTKQCFGGRVAWVPWRRPGFQLGLDVAAIQRANEDCIGVVLGGHGITAWGSSSRECEARSLEIIRGAERFIAERGRPEPFGAVLDGFEPLAEGARQRRAAALGTSCPDHFLRTKVRPMVLDLPPSTPLERVVERLRELHAAYREAYQAYYGRHASPDSPPMRGADPAIVLVPGIGSFSFGADKQTARVAGEFYEGAINAMRGAEALSSYAPIPESEKFRIEYWALEEAKLRRRPAPKPLAARVALVTGAGSGIGRAISERLAAEGACVVVADLDAGSASAVAGGIGDADAAVAVAADVSDEDQVADAVERATLAFGEVDLVVNNAGLSISKPLLETSAGDWDRQHDVMARGSFLVSREAARVMIAQGLGGDLVYVVSKNGVVAGRDQGQRRQPRRGRPRLGDLRQGLGGAARGRLRRARGGAGRLLRQAHTARARGAPGVRRRRGARAGRRGPVPHHRAAGPGGRRSRRRLPAMSPTTPEGSYVAVDLGAASGRVMVSRVGPSTLELVEAHRFPNVPASLPDGLHWDVLRLYRDVLDGLAVAARDSQQITSVGVDSWGVDYGLLDASGALLGNPYHYRDGRTAGVPDQVHARIPQAELYQVTGVQFLPFNTLYQLAADARAERLDAARTMLLIPDLLGYWLTGSAGAEATNASTTGLLDVRGGRWSEVVLEALGIRPELLPPLRLPGEVLGPLLPEVVAETGLPPSTVLTAVGSHDTASAVVGVPSESTGAAYVSCGTWSLVGVELEHPVRTPESRQANFTNEVGVDGRIRYLRNVMGLWLLQESLRVWARAGLPADLPSLLGAAGALPAGGPVVDPDDPAFLPPGDMPARIRAACQATGQPVPGGQAELVHCILDSLASAYARVLRDAERLSGRRVEVVHLVGGGARNRLLCELTADACGLPVLRRTAARTDRHPPCPRPGAQK